MCCWEWKPRYFCAWCRLPLFWHPHPGRLEPCLSSKITGGGVVANCVEGRVNPVESEFVYGGCCADCARLVGRGAAPAHYRDAVAPPPPPPAWASFGGSGKWERRRGRGSRDVKHSRTCVML